MTTTSLAATVTHFKALAHPGRLRILAMLRHGELCVCQITAVLRLAPSTVSAHLAELRGCGLVTERKDAKWVHYRFSDDATVVRLVHEALSLVDEDRQIREDAELIRSIRRIPVERLCRAGLDLSAIGLRSRETHASPPRAQRQSRTRETRHGR